LILPLFFALSVCVEYPNDMDCHPHAGGTRASRYLAEDDNDDFEELFDRCARCQDGWARLRVDWHLRQPDARILNSQTMASSVLRERGVYSKTGGVMTIRAQLDDEDSLGVAYVALKEPGTMLENEIKFMFISIF
jgi:hypothetical protein